MYFTPSEKTYAWSGAGPALLHTPAFGPDAGQIQVSPVGTTIAGVRLSQPASAEESSYERSSRYHVAYCLCSQGVCVFRQATSQSTTRLRSSTISAERRYLYGPGGLCSVLFQIKPQRQRSCPSMIEVTNSLPSLWQFRRAKPLTSTMSQGVRMVR